MGKKYVTTRLSQAKSSRKRYLEEVKKTEEDIQPIDVQMFQEAEAKRERKNIKRMKIDFFNSLNLDEVTHEQWRNKQ